MFCSRWSTAAACIVGLVCMAVCGLQFLCNTTSAGLPELSTGAVLVDNVQVVFHGGISPNHSVALGLCTPTQLTPPGKSRSVVAAALNCSAAYATVFGAVGTQVNCEDAFDVIVQPCVIDNTSVSCSFTSSSHPDRTLQVALSCGDVTSPNLQATSADGGVLFVLTAATPLACPHEATLRTSFTLADVVVGVVGGACLVALSYTTGHNIFVKGYRGCDALPWVRRIRRRSPSDVYSAVPRDDCDADEGSENVDNE